MAERKAVDSVELMDRGMKLLAEYAREHQAEKQAAHAMETIRTQLQRLGLEELVNNYNYDYRYQCEHLAEGTGVRCERLVRHFDDKVAVFCEEHRLRPDGSKPPAFTPDVPF